MPLPLVSVAVWVSKPEKMLQDMWDAIKAALVIMTLIGAVLSAARAPAQVNIEQIVRQKVQPILPKTGQGEGLRWRSG